MQNLKAILQRARHFSPLLIVLFFGVIHGGAYLILMPPWQHYDEPTHFEYAWLLANRGKLPAAEAFDSGMRREVAASMVEFDFFDNLPAPNLLLHEPWIGIPQTNDAPLYYLLTAIPLWVLRGADVTLQLHAARLVSFTMFLLTLAFCYWTVAEIFPTHKVMHWLLPSAIALTPAFSDLMTAVNNDVGATLFFTIFLWAGARFMMRPGINFFHLGIFILAAGICFYTKNTVMFALPMVLLLLIFKISQAPPPWGRLVFPVSLLYGVVGGLYLLSWQDAASWYRGSLNVQQARATQAQFSDGNQVLTIQFTPDEKRALTLNQPLNTPAIETLRGNTYTLGAWIWATEPIDVQLPALFINGEVTYQTGRLSERPTFFSVTGTLLETVTQVRIALAPLPVPPDHPVTIYFDDLVLAAGEFAAHRTPTLAAGKQSGTWGSKDFLNLVRNSSAERTWLIFKPATLIQLQPQNSIPIYALPAMQDLRLTFSNYRNTVINLFESYWARFGWNHVRLPQGFYFCFVGFSMIGGLATFGWMPKFTQHNSPLRWTLLWFALCLGLLWTAAIARQILPYWGGPIFTPSARYAYPVILPSALGLMSGWYLLSRAFSRLKGLAYFPIAFLIFLDITSLIVIFRFYHMAA
jgi:hypothetical protein